MPTLRRSGLWATALLGVWYAATMARDLMWFDSGEFALVGAQLGVGHPPGQPLYTLLLWLSTQGPWSPLVGMNGLSALTAALCALPADALLRRLMPELTGWRRLTALLTVGVLAPVWDQATRIELYAPATLGVLTLIAAGVAVTEDDRGAKSWLGLGVGVGLLGCLNAVFALAAAVVVGGYAAPRLLRDPKRLTLAVTAAAVGAALGLAPYLQIVLGHADPGTRFVWGELSTVDGWRAFLTGRDYGHTEHAAWGKVPGHLLDWFAWLFNQGAAAGVLLGAMGWLVLPSTRRRLWLVLIPAAMGVAFALTYGRYHPQVPDYNGYFAPAMWLGAVGIGALLNRARAPVAAALAVTLVAGGLVVGERPVWRRSRAGQQTARLLAEAWLNQTPPNGVLVIESDHLVFPLMYLQAVEHRRPDVVVFNIGFGASSWYWRWLWATHPDLPKIALPAPSTAARLARLLAAAPDRPVRVEQLGLANGLRRVACLDTFGLRTADPRNPAGCNGSDDPAAFAAQMTAAWAQPDLITPHVLAHLAWTRASAAWALGDASVAISALAVGAPGARPTPPPGLKRPPNARPLTADLSALIGAPAHNIALGRVLLEALGEAELAAAWVVQ